MIRSTSTVLVLLLGLGAAGCVEKSQELSSAEREQLAQFVGTERPSPQHELEISFENKVELIGYDLEPERATPGQPLTVTWYWHSKRPLEEGWNLFTHVADASGNNRLNHDGDSAVRRMYQPGRWKAGEYITDQQRITIPSDWNSPRATFYLGIWNGPHRLQVTQGPNDGENRARAVTVPVEGSQAEATPQVAALMARRTATPIQLDGKLEEEAWQQAAASPRFVNTLNGGAAEPNATVKVLWDDEHLYVGFEVEDDFLKSDFDERDAHLWEQDAVEVMIDPQGDGQGYFEIQVSPKGVVFDTRYDTPRNPRPFGHMGWDSELRVHVDRRGTVGDDQPDRGYTVEMAIPWTAFAAGVPAVTRPSANDVWRMNFFVMDARPEGDPRAVAWSPPRVGDFHVLDRFGRILFVDPSAPQAEGAEAAPPALEVVPTQPRVALPPNVVNRLRENVGQRGTLQQQGQLVRPGEGEEAPTRESPSPTPMTGTKTPPTP